ncbi:acyltransferase [uncultured Akkermansia sp.]|uniref:acyltransferase n=1 Tax=uncultured Akkermansia sp. TaxID=512294 RepID=UPI0031B88416
MGALRGFTMLVVVFTHIQYFCYGDFTQIRGGGGNSLMYRDLFVLFFMPLFFFVSGFVLYKPQVDWSTASCLRFVGKKGLLLLLPTAVFITLYIAVFDPPLSLLGQSGRLGYWFTIALFEYYLLYVLFRWLSQFFFKCNEGIDWLLIIGSAILYFFVTQSVLGRLGISDDMIGLLGLDQLKFFFYFAIGTLAKKHFDHLKTFMRNGRMVALCIIAFLSLFLLVHNDGFKFSNAMVYHAYNFVGGLLSLFLVFLFFYKYQDTFENTKNVGRALQYIGRHTLAIYMLHYFFLPRNLQFIGNFFVQHPNSTIELFVSMGIAILVICISLLANAVICSSPVLAHYLFGKK